MMLTGERLCRAELAKCYYLIGQLLGRSERAADGKVAASKATEILERLHESEQGSVVVRARLASSRILQSELAMDAQQFDEAEAFSKMAIDLWGELVKENPHDQETLLSLAKAQSELGAVLLHRSLSRWREAEALLLESLGVFRRTNDSKLATSSHQLHLAETLRTLGQICKVTRRGDDAIEYISEAVVTVDRIRLAQPSVRSHAIQLAGLYNELSVAHALNNHPADERRCLEKAVELLDSLQSDTEAELTLAVATNLLGKHWLNDGNLAKAEPLLDRAIGLAERVRDRSPDERQLATIYPAMLENRANLFIQKEQFAEALSNYDRAVEVATLTMRAPKRMARGRVYLRVGNHRRAMIEVRETLDELPPETSAHVWSAVLKDAAKLCAQCSAKVSLDGQLTGEEQAKMAEEYAAAAVDLLRQAVNKGFQDLQSLSTTPELQPLYEREDFKSLSKEVSTH